MALARFVARRLAYGLLLVAIVSSGANLLARLAPGDYASLALVDKASPQEVVRERQRLGLDASPLVVWARWAGGAVRLDFGESFKYHVPVTSLVIERALNTTVLAVAALVLATLFGLGAATTLAGRRGAVARLAHLASTVAVSLPPLVLALVLAWVAARTGWVPTGGMSSDLNAPGLPTRLWDLGRHLVVPCLALAVPLAASLHQLLVREMSGALHQPAVVQARARGIPPGRVRWRHAFPLAVTPLVAVYGLIAGSLLGGAFGVEVVTAWPGLGRLTYEALLVRDVPLAAGCAAAGAGFVAVATLASDLALVWIDPRTLEQ